jgi:UDP-2,3-diacylglucosamine pyrophosphatase LpxH
LYRSVFISDVHLGTKSCKAKRLHDFLLDIETENLYLVGDIIDGWALRRKHYWTKTQTEIIRRVLKMSEKINVVYIAGNHDDFIRPFFKFDFQIGDIQILDSVDYDAIDGRRIFVCHGDRFDVLMKIPRPVINFFGHFCEGSFTDRVYKWMGQQKLIEKYLTLHGYDSSISGHTHDPMITPRYMNCGDWTENCTALVETQDGHWEIIRHAN